MTTKLPSRPNLDRLRKQAKSLLAALAAGEDSAVQSFKEHLPAAKGLTTEGVRRAGFRLADAQSVVARTTGFAAWPHLARHVEQLRSLEGTWTFANLEVDGSPVPPTALGASRLLIDGDRFRTESPEAVYEGVFNINVEASPHHIDIEFVEGPEAGNSNHGIFTLEGDRLSICLDMHGKPRPTAFKTAPGSGHACEVLVRQSATRPEHVKGGDRTRQERPKPSTPPADPAAFAFTPSATLARLEGEWSAESITRDGQALPAFMLKTASRSAARNEVKIKVGGMTIIHALMRIDDAQSPAHVEYCNIGGPAKGTLQYGVMEWRGDVAWFCMASPGQPRPGVFKSVPGSGTTLSAWKKK